MPLGRLYGNIRAVRCNLSLWTDKSTPCFGRMCALGVDVIVEAFDVVKIQYWSTWTVKINFLDKHYGTSVKYAGTIIHCG